MPNVYQANGRWIAMLDLLFGQFPNKLNRLVVLATATPLTYSAHHQSLIMMCCCD